MKVVAPAWSGDGVSWRGMSPGRSICSVLGLACVGLVLLASCDGQAGPSTAPPVASPPPVLPPGSPSEASPPVAAEGSTLPGASPVDPPRDPAAAGEASPSAPLIGWWRGDRVCLELFANGDFELSDLGDEPKVMVMGKASVGAEGGDGFALQLATERIWKGRYVSSCRKHHEYGGFIDSRDMLGVQFEPGTATALKLRRVGDAQVELCGVACATLTRATPALGARWRRAQMDFPDRPGATWQAGDLLELDLNTTLGHVWAGVADGKFATVYARVEVQYVSPDRFRVTLRPERYADAVVAGVPPTALGLRFPVGASQVLDVRRLSGERVEVCAAADRCATLERQFDGGHYDLD